MRDTGATDQQGRGIFQGSLVGATNWAVHWLPERDHGIDGIVELTDKDGKPDGGRVALQVKSGPSYFSKPKKDKDGNVIGWWRAVPVRHRTYWLKQAMPVYVVLVNTDTGEWFYERITDETCVRSGSAYRVLVPASQQVVQATVQWRQDAETYRALTRQGYAQFAKLLPPTAADGLEKLATVDAGLADLVAAHLVGVDPELNVQLLLSAWESWLRGSPSHLFATIGSFASENELYSLGADALEIASAAHAVDAERQGVLLALAGMLAAGLDDARAQDLLDRAERTGSVVGTRRVELVRIQHDPDKLAAFRPEAWRGSDDPGLASQAALVGFVHHHEAGRIDAAVAELRRSLELQPRATRQMVWQADMLLLRASTNQAHPGDPAAALDLVRRTSQQRQLWNGPTRDLFALELKALALLSREEEALALIEAALGDDDHTASLLSERVALAMTADMVAAFGREDLADRLILVLEPTSIVRQVLEFRRASGHDQEAGEDWLAQGTALVGRAVDASDARLGMSVISVLSGRGADVDGLLDELEAADLLKATQVRTLKAQFLAERNLDAALPDLRHAARTEMGAAEVLLHMLVRAGRLDEAVAKLDTLAAHQSKAALTPKGLSGSRQ